MVTALANLLAGTRLTNRSSSSTDVLLRVSGKRKKHHVKQIADDPAQKKPALPRPA